MLYAEYKPKAMVSGLEKVEIWNLTDNETNKMCVSLGHKSAKYKDIEWQPPHPPTSTTIKAVGEKIKSILYLLTTYLNTRQ